MKHLYYNKGSSLGEEIVLSLLSPVKQAILTDDLPSHKHLHHWLVLTSPPAPPLWKGETNRDDDLFEVFMSIKNALQELLSNLNKVENKYPQIHDTAVREDLHAAIIDHFVFEPSGGGFPLDRLSSDFSMLRAKGDKLVHKALLQFLTHPDVKAARLQLKTPEERLDAFQDSEVESSNGSTYDNYFGWSDGLPPR